MEASVRNEDEWYLKTIVGSLQAQGPGRCRSDGGIARQRSRF